MHDLQAYTSIRLQNRLLLFSKQVKKITLHFLLLYEEHTGIMVQAISAANSS